MGDSGAFWLYAAVCFTAIVFTLITIPETKGKTLQVTVLLLHLLVVQN
jgi:hypothetical protein